MNQSENQQTLKKPRFVKLDQVFPGVNGFNVYVKIEEVTKTQVVREDGVKLSIAEGTAGDEMGLIKFRVSGPEADKIEKGKVVGWRNGISEVFQEHHRLSLDKFGRITVEDVAVTVNQSGKKYSDVAYEQVSKDYGGRRNDEKRQDDRRNDNRNDDRRNDNRNDNRKTFDKSNNERRNDDRRR